MARFVVIEKNAFVLAGVAAALEGARDDRAPIVACEGWGG